MDLATWYLPLRHLHVGAVALSLTLFAVRGAAVLAGHTWPMRALVRHGSVAIDTVLLAAGVSLWALLDLNPVRNTWLGAKLVLLVVCIVLGSFALKRARSRAAKAAFYVASLLCVFSMIAIAIAHDPMVIWRILTGAAWS